MIALLIPAVGLFFRFDGIRPRGYNIIGGGGDAAAII
jgi:hypothetical protein